MREAPCSRVGLSLCVALLALPGCLDPAATTDSGVGTLKVPLRTEVGDITYELQNARFSISGTTTAVMSSDEVPEATALTQELPVGEYALELEPDWQLVQLDAEESITLEAILLNENPTPFAISEAATTQVTYHFAAGNAQIDLSPGTLELRVSVTPREQRSVIFTELMVDPAEVSDSAGEWLELRNTGAQAVNLQGCSVARDETGFTIDGSLEVLPGATVTLASGEAPGFAPDYVYSGMSLPNSSAFVLTLGCGEQQLDSLAVDPSLWPGGNGVAASLTVGAATREANDDPQRWCAATTAFTSDFGTPGGANPEC